MMLIPNLKFKIINSLINYMLHEIFILSVKIVYSLINCIYVCNK